MAVLLCHSPNMDFAGLYALAQKLGIEDAAICRIAIAFGRLEWIRELQTRGFRFSTTDTETFHLYCFAIKCGKAGIMEYILNQVFGFYDYVNILLRFFGIKEIYTRYKYCLDAESAAGSAYVVAAQYGHQEVLKFFDLKLNPRRNRIVEDMLQAAIKYGQWNILEWYEQKIHFYHSFSMQELYKGFADAIKLNSETSAKYFLFRIGEFYEKLEQTDSLALLNRFNHGIDMCQLYVDVIQKKQYKMIPNIETFFKMHFINAPEAKDRLNADVITKLFYGSSRYGRRLELNYSYEIYRQFRDAAQLPPTILKEIKDQAIQKVYSGNNLEDIQKFEQEFPNLINDVNFESVFKGACTHGGTDTWVRILEANAANLRFYFIQALGVVCEQEHDKNVQLLDIIWNKMSKKCFRECFETNFPSFFLKALSNRNLAAMQYIVERFTLNKLQGQMNSLDWSNFKDIYNGLRDQEIIDYLQGLPAFKQAIKQNTGPSAQTSTKSSAYRWINF